MQGCVDIISSPVAAPFSVCSDCSEQNPTGTKNSYFRLNCAHAFNFYKLLSVRIKVTAGSRSNLSQVSIRGLRTRMI